MTETLVAWGIPPIACTRFCEQPALVHVGGTKDPDIQAIIRLRPDLVVMDREENRREDAEALTAVGIAVHATHVTSIDDVATEMATVRLRLGLPSVDSSAGMDDVVVPTRRRSAFVAIWRRPWMTCNAVTYGSSMLDSIGIANIYARSAVAYPDVTLDDVARRAPDLILLPSEPYPFAARHIAELAEAVPGAEVRLVDGQDLFWWGARTVAARKRLAQALAFTA